MKRKNLSFQLHDLPSKSVQNKTTDVNEVQNREKAIEVIAEAIESYVEKFCK